MLHQDILDLYFWSYIHNGLSLEETPLFRCVDIKEKIALHFNVSLEEAEQALEDARKEVDL